MSLYQFQGKEPAGKKGTFVRPEATVTGGVSSGEGRHVGAGAVISRATLGRHVLARTHPVIHHGVSIGDQAVVRERREQSPRQQERTR